jgi:hypothetical protein
MHGQQNIKFFPHGLQDKSHQHNERRLVLEHKHNKQTLAKSVTKATRLAKTITTETT